MPDAYDNEPWWSIIRLVWQKPPLNWLRVGIFGLDGSNAVAVKVNSAGEIVTSGSGTSTVEGVTAHDDAGATTDPVAVGGYAWDYEPDSAGEQGPAAVSADVDVTRLALNRRGELIEAVKAEFDVPTNIATVYDDSPTSALSDAIECWQYRQATLAFSLDSSGVSTHFIVIEILCSLDGTNFHKLMNGPLAAWIYDDVICASGINRCLTFPVACHSIKVQVVATNTTGANLFTLTNPAIYFRT